MCAIGKEDKQATKKKPAKESTDKHASNKKPLSPSKSLEPTWTSHTAEGDSNFPFGFVSKDTDGFCEIEYSGEWTIGNRAFVTCENAYGIIKGIYQDRHRTAPIYNKALVEIVSIIIRLGSAILYSKPSTTNPVLLAPRATKIKLLFFRLVVLAPLGQCYELDHDQ